MYSMLALELHEAPCLSNQKSASECIRAALRRVEFTELLEKADIISINVPLSDSTKHMFNKEVIGRMKKGAWLVRAAQTSDCLQALIALGIYSSCRLCMQPP